MKGLLKLNKGIKPKTQLRIYDYLQTERGNPNRPIDDFLIKSDLENDFNTKTLTLVAYAAAGTLIYFFTRLSYDKEWDRYYHVHSPMAMEFFDVLSKYYLQKKEDSLKALPESISEFINSYRQQEKYELPKGKNEKLVEVETKVSEELAKMLDIEDTSNIKNERLLKMKELAS